MGFNGIQWANVVYNDDFMVSGRSAINVVYKPTSISLIPSCPANVLIHVSWVLRGSRYVKLHNFPSIARADGSLNFPLRIESMDYMD